MILEQQCSSAVCMYCSQSTWLLDRLERLEGREEEDEAIGLISFRRCVLLLLLDQEGRMDVERANKTSLSLSPSLSPLASPVMDWCREIRKTRTTWGPRSEKGIKLTSWAAATGGPTTTDWLTDWLFFSSFKSYYPLKLVFKLNYFWLHFPLFFLKKPNFQSFFPLKVTFILRLKSNIALLLLLPAAIRRYIGHVIISFFNKRWLYTPTHVDDWALFCCTFSFLKNEINGVAITCGRWFIFIFCATTHSVIPHTV